MAGDFVMPKLGLTMEAGTVVEWLVADGAEVRRGQPVLRIETDKVSSDVEATETGRLRQLAAASQTYQCGEVIGRFHAASAGADPKTAVAPAGDGASPSPPAASAEADPKAGAAPAGGRVLASPNARRVAAGLGVDLAAMTGTGPGGRIVASDVETAAASALTAPSAPEPVPAPAAVAGALPAPAGPAPAAAASVATVAARQLADLLGVDIGEVPASSPDLRVTREDVAAHVRRRLAAASGPPAPSSPASFPAPPAPAPAPPASAAALQQPPTKVIPFKGMRRTIARRMHQSLQEMAQLTLILDADMTGVIEDRRRRQEAGGTVPGFTDYVIAAAAAALREHPYANSQITDDGVALLPDVHIGMAVALDAGLIVPVIRHADQLDIGAVAAVTARLAAAARSGKLSPDEVRGGTFTVTAMGMYGVDAFTPVINPPNTAILGAGRVRDSVKWDGASPRRTSVLTLSLTWDHRAFDGAPAAQFASAVRNWLEGISQ